MSQSRRRPQARPSQKRRSTNQKRHQAILGIFGVLVAFTLVASVAGPPLVDYLTHPNDDSDVTFSDDTEDPVEQQYLDLIADDPNDAETMAALGSYYGNTGRVDEAIPWYEKALALEPENWDIRLGFGRALANGDKRTDAELQYKKVIEARPNDEQAHFSLAQLYQNWVPPRTEEAIAEYETVLAVAPPDAFVRERAIEELAQLGVASPIAASPVATPISTEESQ